MNEPVYFVIPEFAIGQFAGNQFRDVGMAKKFAMANQNGSCYVMQLVGIAKAETSLKWHDREPDPMEAKP